MSESESRREFFYRGASIAALFLPVGFLSGQQQQSETPPRPRSTPTSTPSQGSAGGNSGQGNPFPSPPLSRRDPASVDGSAPAPDPKEVLKANDKDIKSNVLRLSELAQELKQEVEKTDSANVLSLPMLHKAEEIEKLAHHIASLARG